MSYVWVAVLERTAQRPPGPWAHSRLARASQQLLLFWQGVGGVGTWSGRAGRVVGWFWLTPGQVPHVSRAQRGMPCCAAPRWWSCGCEVVGHFSLEVTRVRVCVCVWRHRTHLVACMCASPNATPYTSCCPAYARVLSSPGVLCTSALLLRHPFLHPSGRQQRHLVFCALIACRTTVLRLGKAGYVPYLMPVC